MRADQVRETERLGLLQQISLDGRGLGRRYGGARLGGKRLGRCRCGPTRSTAGGGLDGRQHGRRWRDCRPHIPRSGGGRRRRSVRPLHGPLGRTSRAQSRHALPPPAALLAVDFIAGGDVHHRAGQLRVGTPCEEYRDRLGPRSTGGEHQRGLPPHRLAGVGGRPLVQQRGDRAGGAGTRGEVQRGGAGARDGGRVGPGLKQRGDHRPLGAPARHVQRRVTAQPSPRLDVGPGVEEKLDDLDVAVLRGPVQTGHAVAVGGSGIRSLRDQVADRIDVLPHGGVGDRCVDRGRNRRQRRRSGQTCGGRERGDSTPASRTPNSGTARHQAVGGVPCAVQRILHSPHRAASGYQPVHRGHCNSDRVHRWLHHLPGITLPGITRTAKTSRCCRRSARGRRRRAGAAGRA